MIENLYFFYREYYSLMFNLGWTTVALLVVFIFLNAKNEKNQRKIVILMMLIGFPIIGFNFWMDSYSNKFGMKYTILLLEEATEMTLEKNYYDKNSIKKNISVNELLRLAKEKESIAVTVNTKSPTSYIIDYASRPEKYDVFRCGNKKKCLRMGEIKNKDFINLVEKKIEEEKKK